MSSDAEPIVGNWYRRHGKGQVFEVVAVDAERQLVELQHFDGDIEEMELASWYEDEMEAMAPPQDWSGPVDDLETDDLHYTETAMSDEDWRDDLSEFREPPVVEQQRFQGEAEEEEERTVDSERPAE